MTAFLQTSHKPTTNKKQQLQKLNGICEKRCDKIKKIFKSTKWINGLCKSSLLHRLGKGFPNNTRVLLVVLELPLGVPAVRFDYIWLTIPWCGPVGIMFYLMEVLVTTSDIMTSFTAN